MDQPQIPQADIPKPRVSKHARTRMSQRGYRNSDLDLILLLGTEIDGDGTFVSDRSANAAIAAIERVRGKAIFIERGVVVSAYRPSTRDRRRRKRRSPRRAR